MKTIGFDLDGVLYPWHKMIYLWLYCNDRTTKSYYDFWEETIRENGEFSDDLYWKNLEAMSHIYGMSVPKPEDVAVIQKLSESYNIVYITHRDEELRFVTEGWLNRYKFPSVDRLHMGKTPKALTVRFYDCDYYIEDRMAIVESLIGVTNVIMMRTDWNERLWNSVHTIESLQDLPEVLE